jgi:protein arginine kinase
MNSTDVSFGAWYNEPGFDNDVVLSTRVRLARNLVNFPFPSEFKQNDGSQVQSLVFDAFNKITSPEVFQTLAVSNLEPMGQHILIERGVIEAEAIGLDDSGIAVSMDGKTSCEVNCHDHVRIASFTTGCDTIKAFEMAKNIDDKLQTSIQFAAAVDFGYLTASLNDTGTGMKVSTIVHLPSLGVTDGLETLFNELAEKGISAGACYGPGIQAHTVNGTAAALGDYYQLSTGTSMPQKEADQLALLKEATEYTATCERKARQTVIDKMQTSLKDSVYRAYSQVLYCRLMNESEAIDMVSRLKWGSDCGLLSGVDSASFCSLLYRLRSAHLGFVNRSGTLKFESDITTEEQKIRRLRSLIMQETCEPLKIIKLEK